ncbi:MAG: aldehyde dehydrogenase [Candidatus Aeolococcus gillhamiae]|uniref:Aldehyde dehydrogenase n=3 Tax=Candidatus Aeolococcus gillhamiae TaxID=3127015 RepID=A0A2W5ZF12_9BACT|nr:MAG: aldehyde dehydrogenase [Candidatus Dormibacter sp. RRmetagenome_bin12]
MATIVRPEVATYQQYIDGEWTGAATGETFDVLNPSTEEVVALAPAGSREDARLAIAAARRSFDAGDWRNKSQLQRSQIMFEIAKHLAERSGEWALLESQTAGATIRKASIVDVPLAIETFRSMAEQALQIPWYEPLPWIDIPHVSWNFVQREAIGVCTGIIPFNFPLLIAMWKLAPALAMGNSVVLKPSPFTPLTLLEVARAIDETGLLPRGVLNVVTGPGNELGEELVVNEDVDKVAFTGSTAVGRRILEMAAPTIKKVTLELGGKSANIVCADADLDIAVDGTLFGTFFHQGQACESGHRLYVHDDVYDAFMERLVATARDLRVGDATDFDTQVGPLISRRQYENVLAAIDRAEQEGATVLVGGGRATGVGEKGHFVQPTVITDVRADSNLATEEVFGPVLAVQRWSDPGDIIRRANRSIYGLAGGIWSRDTRAAIEMAKQLRTGTVWINDWHMLNSLAPFGGYRQSGTGRELGSYGLREYTEVKHIHVDQNVPRRERYFYDVLLG